MNSLRRPTHRWIVDPVHPDAGPIAEAAALLRAGGLVAFPTETVYGLGADALSDQAVAGIFQAKGRPANDPLIIHIADWADMMHITSGEPPLARPLADHFWPGPLTLILPRGERVPGIVTSQQDTVAVRMPDHPVALALIRQTGRPIAAPSANRFSRPSPTLAEHVLADLDGRIDGVLDAGPTHIGVESTILDLTRPVPTVLRPGGTSLEALEAHLGVVAFQPRFLALDEVAPAPGNLLRHYAPDADLLLYRGERNSVLLRIQAELEARQRVGQSVGLLLSDTDLDQLTYTNCAIGRLGDETTIASRLFAGLRDLELAGVAVILARLPNETGLGRAVADRLMRAAEGRIITTDHSAEER